MSSVEMAERLDALMKGMSSVKPLMVQIRKTTAVAAAAGVKMINIATAGGNMKTAGGSGAAAASSSSSIISRPPLVEQTKKQRVLEYIALNRNAGTRKAYGSSWGGFARYLEKHNIVEKDLDEFDVADYLRVRVDEQGVAAATLGNDRAAIADRLKNTPNKHVVHTETVASMMAVLRTQAAPSKPKQHMAAELMRELVETHDAKGPSGRQNVWLQERDLFLMLLMMMAFLREGEAVALKHSDVEVKSLPVQGKIQKVLHIFIARSKTDQEKVGHVVLLGEDLKNPSCCPIRRYDLYIAAVKKSGVQSEMFFPTVSGTPMNSTTPCGIVQRAVRQANADAEAGGFGIDRWGEPDSYGSHSLRRGGVTTARGNGVSMLDIQKHGRWKSLTVFSYVGTTPAEQLAVTNSFLGEAKSVAENHVVEGAAAASSVEKKDEVPSPQAHILKAAAAAKSAKGKSRGRKRAAEDDIDEEEESEAARAIELEEDALLEAACNQGFGEDKEEVKGKRTPFRKAKSSSASKFKE